MTIPLPEPQPVRDRNLWTPLYTADQMLAYAEAYGDARAAEERERLREVLMEKHKAAKGQHNYYHCLAVELFGNA